MDRPTLEVADIFRRDGDTDRDQVSPSLATSQRRVMAAIEPCRTAARGGHIEQCDACARQRIAYHSCANRHCPTCQSLARAAWVDQRTTELLDCEYFHVVVTVPAAIAAIALQHNAVVYRLLFRATADTLRTSAADPRHLGAEIGGFAVRHTWGHTLVHHPPLHGVVPGGGLSPDGTQWVACRPGFFLPVRVLSRLFRRLCLQSLQAAYTTGTLSLVGTLETRRDPRAWASHLAPVRQPEWVVYAKRPFGGPQQVLDSVGRSPHRVAISNHRLLDSDGDHVRFRYQDYRADPSQTQKTMTLTAAECIRRVLLHVLPAGFHRIRSYGCLGNRHRAAKLARCRQLLGTTTSISTPSEAGPTADDRDRPESLTGVSLRVCIACHQGHLIVIERLPPIRRVSAIPDTS